MKVFDVTVLLFLVVSMAIIPGDAWLQSVWQGIQRDAKNLGQRLLGEAKTFGTKVVQTVITQSRQTACQEVCPKVCSDQIGRWVCPFVCNPVCPKTPAGPLAGNGDLVARVKRSLVKGQHYSGHLMPLPNKFSAYDLNEDGVVSLAEMAVSGGSDVTDPGFRKAFTLSDVDGNGVLTPKELYQGPFVFEKDVGKSDYLYCKYLGDHVELESQTPSIKDTIAQIPRVRAKSRIISL
ncbi:EF-hand calcium-binding domain-containing protein 1-like [Gigantopelta aegis]|uniref:EF-hand calcium-binding domain-containing protein 1-like n=1 Tax=Gigantopelta aegis TaxID=1735272 RepID=UPI001B88D06B|nr:EF-hand calcium-binding domain-containing protein 1-like [Gigantopelta aegis]XP_041371815.1 EF-hand calcium-binding domain-containing protein 1-like [Gigantopelta aegis]